MLLYDTGQSRRRLLLLKGELRLRMNRARNADELGAHGIDGRADGVLQIDCRRHGCLPGLIGGGKPMYNQSLRNIRSHRNIGNAISDDYRRVPSLPSFQRITITLEVGFGSRAVML
jgi:hypothetical protein